MVRERLQQQTKEIVYFDWQALNDGEKRDTVLPRVMISERANSMCGRLCHLCHDHWGYEFQPDPEHVYSSIKMEASALVLGFRFLIDATEEKNTAGWKERCV